MSANLKGSFDVYGVLSGEFIKMLLIASCNITHASVGWAVISSYNI